MFVIPNQAKIAIGLGAAFVASFTAYQATIDSLDLTEEKINDFGAKIKNRKNAQPAPAE